MVCSVMLIPLGRAAAELRRREAERAEVLVPPDVPIEMIAEEVKESWRLKEVHVEKLMQKARALSVTRVAAGTSRVTRAGLVLGRSTKRSCATGSLRVSGGIGGRRAVAA